MAKIRSPFLSVENFISPLVCERLIKELGVLPPAHNANEPAVKNERILKDAEYISIIKSAVQAEVPRIEERYNGAVIGMEPPVFTQYFEDPKNPCEPHGCESSRYLRKKWVKVKDIDLVGYIWLKDFNNGVPLDPRFEVYGGKLEFPAYNFSIVPQRGTLVLYPGTPHFISAISPILVGSLEQIKITVKLKAPNEMMWIYNPKEFAGTYVEWFSEE